MNKLYHSFLSLLSGLLLLSGCNNQEELSSLQQDDTSLPPYSVTFRLGGSVASNAAATRASSSGTEIQTSEEKALNSLYAVVFKNAAGGSTTGDPVDNDNDKFYAAFPVDLNGYQQDPQANPVLSFSLAEAGNFQVCFVANPSGYNTDPDQCTGLVKKIVTLTKDVSTVNDFKNLVETTVLDNAAAPSQYLMTSPFYTLTTSYSNPQTIEEVVLTRAMARFDIINAADGYTITQVVFHNRAIKTPIIADTPTYDSDKVASTPYDNMGLVGNSQNPTTKDATIYSFEQYAGSTEKSFSENIEGLPYLEVKYQMPSVSSNRTYSHKVYFKKAKAQADQGYDVLPIKRNTLYKVKMMNDTHSNLTFQISVLDWDKNTEITVTDENLVDGVSSKPLEEAAVGDYYMKDGTLRDGKKDLPASEKSQVIGIVFQTYEEAAGRFGTKEVSVLSDKGVQTPHGLVMAVKDASDGAAWGPSNQDESSITDVATMSQYYKDLSGLAHYQVVAHNSYYPAFKAVADFEDTVPAPFTSTGWFLPSAGQWLDILANLGGLSNYMDDVKSSDSYHYTWNYLSSATSGNGSSISIGTTESYYVQKQINSYLTPWGDSFSVSGTVLYWTSSESSNSSVFINFSPDQIHMCQSSKSNSQKVRAILAF